MITLVDKDKCYKIHYCIKNLDGDVLEKTEVDSPLNFYVGDGSVLKKIEQAVIARVASTSDSNNLILRLLPEDAFGKYDASLIYKVKRTAFHANEPLTLDQRIYANTPSGKRLVKITDITSNTVTINANHDLAGNTLIVELNILD